MRRMLIALSTLVVLASGPALATCNPGQSPFTDVDENDIFCGSALWVRNALVTTGCGNGTTYCPDTAVTRAQMALFMKRLVRAATPDIVYANLQSQPADLDGGFATCLTSVYSVPAGGNARLVAHATGTVSLLTTAAADVSVAIQRSLNGGGFSTFGANAPRTVVPGNQWTVVPVIGGQTMTGGGPGLLIAPGSTAQFRIFVLRQGASTGEVTDSRCQLMVHLPPDAVF